jgi:hypothetical protein
VVPELETTRPERDLRVLPSAEEPTGDVAAYDPAFDDDDVGERDGEARARVYEVERREHRRPANSDSAATFG